MVIQEVEQIELEKLKWCLKYMMLQFDGIGVYYGDWKVDGCMLGKVYLV